MLGRLLNTLQYRLDIEEKEWRSLNRLRRELQPNPWRWAVLQSASRPLLFGGAIFCLVSFLALLAAVVDSKYWAVYYVPEFKIPDSVAYFSALWSVQAAVAALVYPIVISFVALLVERRNNAKAPLHVYLHDSAALLAGLSALLLVAEMGLQYFGVPYVSSESLMVWLVFDGAWFILNISLTMHFLFRTFEFIQPARRFEITRRYAVCVAWPREARCHLAKHLFQTAIEGNLLPGPSYGTAKEGEPSVLPGYPGLGSGIPAVTCAHHNRRQLRNIRFRLLAWATMNWLKKANAVRTLEDNAKKVEMRIGAPSIAFPLEPLAMYEEGTTTLCRVEGETGLSWFERLLISLSFDFGDMEREILELTVNDILLDAQGEAIVALRSGEPEAFEESVKRMLLLYESILDASQVRDISGGNASLMTVADRSNWLELPIYRVWSERFVDLFEAAASKLSFGEDYVSVLTHIPNRLFSKAQGKAVPELLKHFISLSPMLLKRIEDWWVRTVEQQGLTEHSLCNPMALRPPFYGGHDKVLREFIGAWESLKSYNLLPKRDGKIGWEDRRQSAEYLEAHLSHTLVMLFGCVLRGDRNGAEWLADVLVKWYGDLRFRFEGSHNSFLRKQRLITIEIMSNKWDEVKRRVEVESFGVSSDELPPLAVLAACLDNLWTDTCCVAIYMLILWNQNCKCDNSLPAEILSHLIKGRALRDGGYAGEDKPPYSGVDELMMAILRQYHADGHYRRGYRNRLDNYIEQISNLSQPEMVAGRGYSRWGSNDLDSVRDGQLSALLLAVPVQWQPRGALETMLDEWARTENEKVREFEQMLRKWKERLNENSFLGLRDSHECLRSKVGGGLDFDAAKLSLDQAIDKLLDVAVNVHQKALADMPPSKGRLAEIAQWASSKAFSEETASFPLPLFGKIEEIDEPLTERSLVINGLKKGEFTDPPMADRAANEEEWFAETVRGYAASSVLAAVLNELRPERMEADNPEAYWTQIKKFANNSLANGLHPLLLLQQHSVQREWMLGWLYPSIEDSACPPPADLVVSKDRLQKNNGYLWSLNEIPVFKAPLSHAASVLLVRESFERIDFSRHPGGHYVKVAAREVQGHPELVDLVLTWQQRISVKKYPAMMLSHGGPQD